MAMKFLGSVSNRDSSDGIRLLLAGDGVAESVTVDLEKAPFRLKFPESFEPSGFAGATLQAVVINGVQDFTYAAIFSMNRKELTITFNKALPVGDFAQTFASLRILEFTYDAEFSPPGGP